VGLAGHHPGEPRLRKPIQLFPSLCDRRITSKYCNQPVESFNLRKINLVTISVHDDNVESVALASVSLAILSILRDC